MNQYLQHVMEAYRYDEWKIPQKETAGQDRITCKDMGEMPSFEGYALEASVPYVGFRGSYQNRYRSERNPAALIYLTVVLCPDEEEARSQMILALAAKSTGNFEQKEVDGAEIAFGRESEESRMELYCRQNVFVEFASYRENILVGSDFILNKS